MLFKLPKIDDIVQALITNWDFRKIIINDIINGILSDTRLIARLERLVKESVNKEFYNLRAEAVQVAKSVTKNELEHIYSEKFIDSVVERIRNKQL